MLSLSNVMSNSLTSLAKGIPDCLNDVRIQDVARQRLNVLTNSLPMPIAVIKEDKLQANIDLMAAYSSAEGVALAPHGKTTMCPQIFERQLSAGAWGMTCATSAHLRVYRRHGVKKIFFANQLMDDESIEFVSDQLRSDEGFEFYTIVDSSAGVRRLHSALGRVRSRRKLNVLLEVGMVGNRTGVRTVEEAATVMNEIIACSDRMNLCGVETFEGVVQDTPVRAERMIAALMGKLSAIARQCDSAGAFSGPEVVLSAGGSAYFDIVVEMLKAVQLRRPTTVLLRSGCYVTHDHGFYSDAFRRLRKRRCAGTLKEACFEPALEVWSMVQSIPEPGLALLTVGKRDLSMDMGMPVPVKVYRQEVREIIEVNEAGQVAALNDHHAYLRFSAISLAVGDLVCLGISHPCTTFDRWRYLYLVNGQYDVVSILQTFF